MKVGLTTRSSRRNHKLNNAYGACKVRFQVCRPVSSFIKNHTHRAGEQKKRSGVTTPPYSRPGKPQLATVAKVKSVESGQKEEPKITEADQDTDNPKAAPACCLQLPITKEA